MPVYGESILPRTMRSDGTAEPSPLAGLGSALRARRQELTLTQAQLADLAGVGVAFLYELERDKPTVRLDKVLAVLDVLGLELHLRPGRAGIAVRPEPGEGGG